MMTEILMLGEICECVAVEWGSIIGFDGIWNPKLSQYFVEDGYHSLSSECADWFHDDVV